MPQVKYTGGSAKPKPSLKAKLKSKNVNVDNLDSRMVGYINNLPEDVLSSIVVTSGNDGSEHSKNSLHYKNRALDLRFNSKLYEFMLDDPNRIKAGIVLIDPNHGTGKHIHISVPTEDDFKAGYSEHTKDVFLNPYSEQAKQYVQGQGVFDDNRKRAVDLGRKSYKGWVYKGGGYDKSAHNMSSKQDSVVSDVYTGVNVRPMSDLMNTNPSSLSTTDTINYMSEQNGVLYDKLAELIDTINKERDYNNAELENNPHKRLLDSRNRFEDFVNDAIAQLPSLVNDSQPLRNNGGGSYVQTPASAYTITHFQNTFTVDS